MALKVGIIGYKNHAKRILDILNSEHDVDASLIFHPTKNFDSRFTNSFNDLLDCDAIFILSPNSTHYEYLKKLETYDGYIFCEKPPVSKIDDLHEFITNSNFLPEKIFFNFNYRFSFLANLLTDSEILKQIGDINHIQIISTHGLAFKNEYLESWRSNGVTNPHNILETSSIHYLDLLNYLFGTLQTKFYSPKIMSNRGTSFDSATLFLTYSGGLTASIFSSYAAPLHNSISIMGTNGLISVTDNEISVYSPRDTFDSNGFFMNPPVSFNQPINFTESYVTSLKDSVDYFLTNVYQKTPLSKVHFDTSLQTTKLIFEIENFSQ